MNTLNYQQDEAITACVYDEQRSGVWLLFTKNDPEFISNIDRRVYSDILRYMAKYQLVREHFKGFFKQPRYQQINPLA